jgi:ribosomal protein S18 acetylase RimI-like enzyme
MSAVKKEDVNIRPMTRSDIHAILILDRKVSEGRGVLSYKDMTAIDPGGPLDLSFVAEVKGKVVGFIIARLAYVMIPLIEVCILQGILVDSDYRGHGIGGKLLDGLLDHCNAEGINTVRAIVPHGNKELRLFVEAHGFRRSPIINYDKTFES